MDYYSALYSYCGVALAYQGDFGEGRRMCEKGLRLASEVNNRYSMAFAHAMFGYVCLIEGDWGGSVSHFENSIRYQQEIEAVIILGITRSALGLAYAYEGNLRMAQSETGMLQDCLRSMGWFFPQRNTRSMKA